MENKQPQVIYCDETKLLYFTLFRDPTREVGKLLLIPLNRTITTATRTTINDITFDMSTPTYFWLFQLFGEANVMMVKEYPGTSVLVSKESISQESLCPHPHCFPYQKVWK